MNASNQMSSIKILRFDPASMKEPMWQEFEIPFIKGNTVTDAILYIHREIDSTLAFRASCQVGLCYGCLIQINGNSRCPCKTYMKERMTLEPLKKKKVIRDLVVELD